MSGTEGFDAIVLGLAALQADATLQTYGIQGYAVEIAQGLNWPYIIGQQQSGQDIEAIGAYRIGDDLLLTFKVVGPDSILTTQVRPAAARMDAVLQGLITGNANVNIVGKLHRQGPISFSEIVDGQVIRHLGGMYATQVQ
jgi:hypothetical protein